MSDLRQHLDSAKDEYKSLRYPGDLAAELSGASGNARRWALRIGIFAAAAAIVTVVVWFRIGGTTPDTQLAENLSTESLEIAAEQPQGEEVEVSFGDIPALSMPVLPTETDFTFVAPMFSFSSPSITLIDENSEQQQDQQQGQQPEQGPNQQTLNMQETLWTV